jgi:hypothetical protein
MDQDNKWPRVPPIGAYAISTHPITCLNPSLIFKVTEIESSGGRISVRGKFTCWFVINETSVRPPTPEEAANLDNYHPEDIE